MTGSNWDATPEEVDSIVASKQTARGQDIRALPIDKWGWVWEVRKAEDLWARLDGTTWKVTKVFFRIAPVFPYPPMRVYWPPIREQGECGWCPSGLGRPEIATSYGVTWHRHRVPGQVRFVPITWSDDRSIFERDNWLCGICGLAIDSALPRTDKWGATVDHKWPQHAGGEGQRENLQAAHRSCNSKKGARLNPEFKAVAEDGPPYWLWLAEQERNADRPGDKVV